MQHRNRWMIVVLIIAALPLAACARPSASASTEKPSIVEEIEGSEFKRVILTQKAAERIDIQTAPVREEQVDGTPRMVVPYATVIYGLKGETWAYTNPEPLVFVRYPISVDYIEGDLVILVDGPAVGTQLVTVGGSLLYGAETGVSK